MMNTPAWFAGMDLVEFTPSGSAAIPPGAIDSGEGSIDMKWKNPTPNMCMVQKLGQEVPSTCGCGDQVLRCGIYREGPTHRLHLSQGGRIPARTTKRSGWRYAGFRDEYADSFTSTRVEHDRKTYTHTYSRPHPGGLHQSEVEGQQAEGQKSRAAVRVGLAGLARGSFARLRTRQPAASGRCRVMRIAPVKTA